MSQQNVTTLSCLFGALPYKVKKKQNLICSYDRHCCLRSTTTLNLIIPLTSLFARPIFNYLCKIVLESDGEHKLENLYCAQAYLIPKVWLDQCESFLLKHFLSTDLLKEVSMCTVWLLLHEH